ncbi:MAG TPA: winged helix-turn-helix domain-containing protein [Vicinamibacterales bacterium]|nr:winged helix-turn-helix domain-containing protein [Vicinamibacterales bacterium]
MAYEFEGFRLDTDRQRLLAAPSGDPIHVSPKVLETLIYLVERRGDLVEKDALMKAMWPRVVVEENNLDRNISTLRRVLGEKAGENRFIATVPGRGYRFVAEVTTAAAESAPALATAPAESREAPAIVLETLAQRTTRRRYAQSLVAAVPMAVVLALAATVVWWVARTLSHGDVSVQRAAGPGVAEPAADDPAVPRVSVAVMPFANRTGDPSLRYLGDGIADELIYALARVKGLTVPARTSSFAYRDRDVDVREIARDLGVAAVLEGSVGRAGDAVRVIVRLADAHTGFNIWSQSYERRADDLLGLQAELASEVVQSLSPSRQVGTTSVGPVRPTASPQAYRLFLEANVLVGASDRNLRAALALYDEALALDPTFARALAGRAAARLVLVSHGSVGLADLSEAERDARAALSIDADVASAHASLAHVLRARGEWLQAEAAYQTALAKSGNDPMILGGHHIMLGLTGRVRASLEKAETAYRLAPLALPTIAWRGMGYSLTGQDEVARREAALARSLGAPTDAGALPFVMAAATERQGRYADAAAHLVPYLPAEARAAGAGAIASTYGAAADPARRPAALAALRDLASKVPFGDMEQRRWSLLLWLYTRAGDLDEAYAAGHRALDEAARSGSIGSSWFVIWFPSMRPFRQDPRFQAFTERLNLAEYWKVYGPPDGCALQEGKIACQ